jgi:endoglucanase
MLHRKGKSVTFKAKPEAMSNIIPRRTFIKNASLASAFALGSKVVPPVFQQPGKNKLPRWRGFNLLDFFTPNPPRNPSTNRTTAEDLKWMVDWGFDFIRIPMAYPRYLNFDRTRDITKRRFTGLMRKRLRKLITS